MLRIQQNSVNTDCVSSADSEPAHDKDPTPLEPSAHRPGNRVEQGTYSMLGEAGAHVSEEGWGRVHSGSATDDVLQAFSRCRRGVRGCTLEACKPCTCPSSRLKKEQSLRQTPTV